MTRKKVVVALGHRALGTTLPEQKTAVKASAKVLADLVEAGADIIITHSNAPQVGMIHTAMNEFGKVHPDYTAVPMSVCSAMSQGYIGYDIQNTLRAELLRRGIYKPVSTILTQVTVDPYDDAFHEPVKIIGRTLTEEEAEAEEHKGNYVVKTDTGYRRIVAAPQPENIVEIDAIKALSDSGQIVIACGGGGIPVLERNEELIGASAVIEKDLTSGKLAQALGADELLILTSVEKVSVNYGSDSEEYLSQITVQEAKTYMEAGHFGDNTMLPKIQASMALYIPIPGASGKIPAIKNKVTGHFLTVLPILEARVINTVAAKFPIIAPAPNPWTKIQQISQPVPPINPQRG